MAQAGVDFAKIAIVCLVPGPPVYRQYRCCCVCVGVRMMFCVGNKCILYEEEHLEHCFPCPCSSWHVSRLVHVNMGGASTVGTHLPFCGRTPPEVFHGQLSEAAPVHEGEAITNCVCFIWVCCFIPSNHT